MGLCDLNCLDLDGLDLDVGFDTVLDDYSFGPQA